MSYIMGVDLGGTWLRVGAVDMSNRTSAASTDVHRYRSPSAWDALTDILKRHNTDAVEGFGVAVSGPVQDHATLIQGPNLPWLTGRNMRHDLERALRKKVIVSNDMEAATEGEMAWGVLKSYDWAIFETISTGWGGNLILDGKRVDGEPGHSNVSFDVPERCGAGHVGCYEALYSGSALERRIRQRMTEAQATENDPWDYFQKAVGHEERWAVSLLDHWAEGVGRAWANTLNRIRPMQAIAYMGTTAENLLRITRVQTKLRLTIRRIAMFSEHKSDEFPILQATFANRSLYGAAVVYEQID
jgi:predicted NBD/HSP70 family sugar kinase